MKDIPAHEEYDVPPVAITLEDLLEIVPEDDLMLEHVPVDKMHVPVIPAEVVRDDPARQGRSLKKNDGGLTVTAEANAKPHALNEMSWWNYGKAKK